MFINKMITVLIFIIVVLYRMMPNDNIETYCEGNYYRELNITRLVNEYIRMFVYIRREYAFMSR